MYFNKYIIIILIQIVLLSSKLNKIVDNCEHFKHTTRTSQNGRRSGLALVIKQTLESCHAKYQVHRQLGGVLSTVLGRYQGPHLLCGH